ncbi:MAG TPA: flavodoxin domain-containing protein [Anaerolineaceae bacterium]|nr:flavodoxin domain-containing protein [Anaerolineaceae bacterium]
MTNKILVTYASRSGSTAGVAEAIGKTLAEAGADVDVRPVEAVSDLSPYTSVVAGSAIQGGKWLPEALDFVRTHRAELARKRFAAFLVCITLSMQGGEQYRSHADTWHDPVRALVRPVSTEVFAGALEFSKMPRTFNAQIGMRLPVLFGMWKTGDHRDWRKIRAWAERLRPLLVG